MKSDDPIYQGADEYFRKDVITELYNSMAWNRHDRESCV